MLTTLTSVLMSAGGAVYLLAYLLCGCVMIRFLLPRLTVLTRVWLGLSLGLLLMMWLPALLAFFVDFTLLGHLLALIPLSGLTLGTYFLRDKRPAKGWDRAESRLGAQMLMIVLPLTLLAGWLQYTHNVRIGEDGGWWVGQSTYGDLAMHMSFVTSLKNASFPPDYAIMPGQQLSYPFLTDSLSTSLYLFGWSLQSALSVPGTLMMALCFMGVMCLAREMTAGKKTLILAALLFFLNGGLGFIYDFDMAGGTEPDGTLTVWSRISEILNGYYTTPTNQPDSYNLQWSNVIADMMVPQRTLLGGWCMVIPCFYLLYMAFDPARREAAQITPAQRLRMVVLLGVWGGALPLIHTHSFAALALCSVGMLLYDCFHTQKVENALVQRICRITVLSALALTALIWTITGALMLISTLADLGWAAKSLAMGALWISLAVLATGALVVIGVHAVLRRRELARVIGWYAIYGATAMVLSVPQLFAFTFNQVFQEGMAGQGNSFIEVWFNWRNTAYAYGDMQGTPAGMRDLYGWFYLKNLGVPFLILILALIERNPRRRRLFAGALPIILAAELIRFQPNIYDNNKLLYLAWLLCVMIVADWCRDMWRRLKGLRARPVIAVLAAVTFFLSAGLTLWREAVSNYQAFSPGAVEVGVYVRDNTEEHSTFLTGVHHLNPVASIAGREIVCGPDLWLYYHGFDTSERKADIRAFYADPAGRQDVLAKYGVEYVMVSSYERSDYRANEAALDALYPVVFENREATIWRVTEE